jgi:hypothetical protein
LVKILTDLTNVPHFSCSNRDAEQKKGRKGRRNIKKNVWTYWKIVGNEYTIAIIEGTRLGEALKIIEENYCKYSSIKTWRATVDDNGNLQEEGDKKTY